MKLPLIAYFSMLSFVVPIFVGSIRYSRLDRVLKLFLGFCIAMFLQVIVEFILLRLAINNLEIENLGMAVETLFLGSIYYAAIKPGSYRRTVAVLMAVYLVLWGVSRLWFHVPRTIDALENTLGKTVIICFGLVFSFYELKVTTGPIASNAMTWVALGSMLYAVGTIVIYGLANVLLKMSFPYFNMAWMINFTLIIVSNLLYAKAFLCTTT